MSRYYFVFSDSFFETTDYTDGTDAQRFGEITRLRLTTAQSGESITKSECRIRVIRVIRGAPSAIRVHLCAFVVKRLHAQSPYTAAGTRENSRVPANRLLGIPLGSRRRAVRRCARPWSRPRERRLSRRRCRSWSWRRSGSWGWRRRRSRCSRWSCRR